MTSKFQSAGRGLAGVILTGVILAGLLAFASAAQAAPPRVWAKTGASSQNMADDLAACRRSAREDASKGTPDNGASKYDNSYLNGGAAGYATEAVAEMIFGAIDAHNTKVFQASKCMQALGYAGVPLTDAEAARVRTIKSAAGLVAWTTALYASDGFAARVAQARELVAAPLPTAERRVWTYGGVQFDPTTLSVTTGVVAPGSSVMSGKISHRATGRLRREMAIHQLLGVSAPAGTILHEIVLPDGNDSQQTYWCGAATLHTLRSRIQTVCLWTGGDGYKLAFASGEAWLATSVVTNVQGSVTLTSRSVVVDLEPSADDLLGSMDFELRFEKIDKKGVRLAAIATGADGAVIFWVGALSFDAQQRAILPFWTHRLTLTRSGAGVVATFSADGDGSGWDAIGSSW